MGLTLFHHFAQLPGPPQFTNGFTSHLLDDIWMSVSSLHPKSNCSIANSTFTNLRSHNGTSINHLTLAHIKLRYKKRQPRSPLFPLCIFHFYSTRLCCTGVRKKSVPHPSISLVLHSCSFKRTDIPFLVCSVPILNQQYTHRHSLAAHQERIFLSTPQPYILLSLTTERA